MLSKRPPWIPVPCDTSGAPGSVQFGYSSWAQGKGQRTFSGLPAKSVSGSQKWDLEPLESNASTKNLIEGCGLTVQHSSLKRMDANTCKEASDQFERYGVHAISAACGSLLPCCGNTKAFSDDVRAQKISIGSGLTQNFDPGSLPLQMFDKRGAMADTLNIFAHLNQRDVASWNVIISAFARQGQHRHALQYFIHMQQEGVLPNKSTLMSIFCVCGNEAALTEGKQIHARIIGSELISDVAVGTALVNMYGKCRSVTGAKITFDSMLLRNVVSWTTMISVYVHHGQGKEALILFDIMLREGIHLDKVTFVSILAACSDPAVLAEAKHMHACILDSGYEQDLAVANALVNMYGKCGSVEDAQKMFDSIQERDVISWTCLMTAHAENEENDKVLQLFVQMVREGVEPNRVTFVCILPVLSSHAALEAGEHTHNCIIEKGYELDVAVANSLINMYGKCGCLENAQRIFDRTPNRNVISWTAIIAVYAEQRRTKEAVKLFERMQWEGFVPNKVTFSCIVDACASQALLAEGKLVHASILGRGFELDVIVGTALIKMYSMCSNMNEACKIFNGMPERDVVTWNTIIAVCTDHEQGKEAFQLFYHMQGEGVMPNKATFGCLLAVSACEAGVNEGVQVHAHVLGAGLELDVVMGTSLINMYGKCGSPENARILFDDMLERSVTAWTAMIAVYAENGQDIKAFQMFQQMQQECILPNKVTFISILMACVSLAVLAEGKRLHAHILDSGFGSEVVVGNALINMYGKCGSLKDAKTVFDNMLERNVVSWTGMIAVCAQQGQSTAALQHFDQMQQQGIMPNEVTFVSVLYACASQACLIEGERIHACILNNGLESDVIAGNAMVTVYGKCGRLDSAQRTFDNMTEWDTGSWNAIIGAYAEHGQGKMGLRFMSQMQQEGYMPDQVTFVNVLVACSHAGLINEACYCFSSVIQEHELSSDHYACMTDLLCRAGLLEEAEFLISCMPFQPTVVSFTALLASCRHQADVERGECAAKLMQELNPKDTAPLFMLSHIYTAAGISDNAA